VGAFVTVGVREGRVVGVAEGSGVNVFVGFEVSNVCTFDELVGISTSLFDREQADNQVLISKTIKEIMMNKFFR
jgi:hypothetical protein